MLNRPLLCSLLIILGSLLAACGGSGSGAAASNPFTDNSGNDGSTGGGTTAGGGGTTTGGGGTTSGSGGTTTGGGGTTGGGSSGSTPTPTANPGANQGQVLLGPIVDANVSVYDADGFTGIAICTVMTTDLDAPEGPGVMDLSTCPINPGDAYYMVVRGGYDVDVDDDGILDPVPTPKQGALRALLTGADIAEGDFRINIITEIAFQSVSGALFSGESAFQVLSRLDSVARQLLEQDLNGDGVIDKTDLLHFSPVTSPNAIRGDKSALLQSILDAILSGDRSDLTRLSRQLMLDSLGEFDYEDLLDPAVTPKNFLVADFLLDDGYLYAAGFDAQTSDFDLKILVVDVHDLSNVELVGKVSMSGLPSNPQNFGVEMSKVGDYLYLVSKGVGMIIADVTDPDSPSATLHFSGRSFFSVETDGVNQLFVSEIAVDLSPVLKTLSLYNLTDPEAPVLQSTIPDHYVYKMDYHEGYLYTSGSGEVAVFDVGTPGSMVFKGSDNFPGEGQRDIAYHDGFVYLPVTDSAAGIQGIAIVNVTDPIDVQYTETLSGYGFVSNLAVQDNMLFAGVSLEWDSSVLTTFEIESGGRLGLRDSRSASGNFYLETEGDRVYISGSTGFIAYNIASLNSRPEYLDFIATPKVASRVQVAGDIAYVADGTSFHAIDVSTPGEGLTILNTLPLIDRILDIKIVDNFAYLASTTEGLIIVDISDPENLAIEGSNKEQIPIIEEPGADPVGSRIASLVTVVGDHAYVYSGTFQHGIMGKFSITDPAGPDLIAETDDVSVIVSGLASKDNHIYTVGSNSLNVYDVAGAGLTLSSQQFLLAKTIEIAGDYAYTTSATSGLSILNVSDSAEPISYSIQQGLGIGNAVSITGNIAYVANELGYVEIYDVTDKTSPEFRSVVHVSGAVRDIFTTDEYIYVVNGLGLVILPAAVLQGALE